MAELETIHLLETLCQHSEFYAGIFLTYGADLAFFEKAILHPLWQNGCRNNLVFMDAQRYADTLGALKDSVTWVGRRYLLIPVDLGALQSFHPKLVFLLGHQRSQLLIGSGNLTFTGFGHNHEVFTCLDWTPGDSDLQHLFAQTWKLVGEIFRRWGHSGEAGTILHKAAHVADWLASPTEPVTDIHLLHTLEEPLIDQCSRALSGESVDRITVLSPFLDQGASALGALHSRFQPKELHLVLQDERAVGNLESLKGLRQSGAPLEVYRFSDDKRYLHAKIYVFETASASYVLTGSANCTRSAWLSTCADGNFEVVLLRRADSQQYFRPLLEAHVVPEAVTSLDEVSIRHQRPIVLKAQAAIRLLDVSVESNMLSLVFCVRSLPEGIEHLQLRLSTTPPCCIPLGQYETGSHTHQMPVSPELQTLLTHPLSASIWGITPDGQAVDVNCNELWISNVDVLRREVSRALPADVRAGKYLADMALGSAEDWRDLYESLTQLIELDVAGLRQRGGTYTASPPLRRSRPQGNAKEKEIKIRLVPEQDEVTEGEEIATALFHESPLHAWLEYVRGGMPGTTPQTSKPDGQPPKPHDKRPRAGEGHRRRWTPERRVGRWFVNLVKKYIRSLTNVEYMQTVSIYHILAYYSVFQRIVWLLLQHDVIDVEGFARLVTEINGGFFGAPNEEPPALSPRLGRYIQPVWRDEWRRAEVPLYALASVILSEYSIFEPPVSQPEDDELAAQMDKIHEQNLRVLCGIVGVMGISWLSKDIEMLAEQVGQVYGQDVDNFAFQLMGHVEHSLSSIDALLDDWIRTATIALGQTDDPHLKALLYRARVDYGLARYDVLEYLQDTDAQVRVCSELIFWMRRTGDSNAAREWSETLVNHLQAQGESLKVAQALLEEGRRLFYSGHHDESANKLRQSLVLAEQLGDEVLSERCKKSLEHAEFFLRLQAADPSPATVP